MTDSPLLFFRLKQGKVWHVACGGALVALCSEPIPDRSERQPKRPPYGGRTCPSCVSVSMLVDVAIVDAERARLAQSVNTTTTTRLYDHDLTDRAPGDPLAVADMQATAEAFVNGGGVPATGYEPVDDGEYPEIVGGAG